MRVGLSSAVSIRRWRRNVWPSCCAARAPSSSAPPAAWLAPHPGGLAAGRLLVVSCFPSGPRRVTTDTAHRRNEFVAALTAGIRHPRHPRRAPGAALAATPTASQPRHPFGDHYEKLKRALRADLDKAAWQTLYSTVSRLFDKPKTGKIAIKVTNHYGDEVMKVYEV
jgi:hypothetical protein